MALDLSEPVVEPAEAAMPALLVSWEPWYRAFFRNLSDLFRPRPGLPKISSPPAPFWPDVFVSSRLPWGRFAMSTACHVLAILAVWGFSQLWLVRPHALPPRTFNASDVVIYPASEYLPPLDTGTPSPSAPKPGEPEYARQPIISVPPTPDNRTQTIVTPPDIKLTHDVPLPNIVAWSQTQIPLPMATAAGLDSKRNRPALPNTVIAPVPDIDQAVERQSLSLAPSVIAPPPRVEGDASRRSVQVIQPAIIEPPPSAELAASRKVGELNIGHSEVVAPAPQFPMAEQRSVGSIVRSAPGAAGTQVVPPPPSIQSAGTARSGRNLIALSIHPAEAPAPIEPPAGNRRGTFAATPEGKPGAPGTPDSRGNSNETGGAAHDVAGSGRGSQSSVTGPPPGLFVGAAPKDATASAVAGLNSGGSSDPASDSEKLVAKITPPRVRADGRHVAAPVADLKATEMDRRIFGPRRFYSLSLNMPNLNSTGGSWVIRFAELKDDGAKGELLAPEAIREVDPAYPMELMRRNVQGTVILHAVIRSDGTVGNITVVNSVDDRLDQYAREALAGWMFRPAEKNGTPVDLEAVVTIPFKPQKTLF